jgi:hypothetical protein
MARSYKFDWSELDRQYLFDILYLIKNKIVNESLTIPKFQDIVVRHLKSHFPVKAKRIFDKEVEKGWVYIGGAYYSDLDKEKKQSIEICLAYNSTDKTIKLTPKKFNNLCIVFADTLLHEIIHMRQFRKRGFKELPDYASTAQRDKQRQEQEYLGNNDEIDAYSFNIACELTKEFNGRTRDIIKFLNQNQQVSRKRFNCWRMYLKAFDHDHRHPIIKRVKKRVVYYLPKALQGKPFRSCDWINH